MRKPLTPEQKEIRRLYNKNFYLLNKEKLKNKRKDYLDENSEKIKLSRKNWYNINKTKVKEQVKKYKKENKDKIKQYPKKKKNYSIFNKLRKLHDNIYRLKTNMRSTLSKIFKRKGFTKKSKSTQILGCDYNEFKQYIESQFQPWMNWGNYGKYNGTLNYGWDIDHIEPLSKAKDENDLIRLNHHTNLQPLCGYINRHIKRDN